MSHHCPRCGSLIDTTGRVGRPRKWCGARCRRSSAVRPVGRPLAVPVQADRSSRDALVDEVQRWRSAHADAVELGLDHLVEERAMRLRVARERLREWDEGA